MMTTKPKRYQYDGVRTYHYERKTTNSYACGYCGEQGHNIRSCRERKARLKEWAECSP